MLENNVVAPEQLADGSPNPLLLCAPEDCAAFFTALGRDDVGLLLDVGHAKVAGAALGFDPADFFARCGAWIRCIHLSDNGGRRDRNAPMTAQSWFIPFLRGFAHPCVIEAYRLEPEMMQRQIEIVEQAVGG